MSVGDQTDPWIFPLESEGLGGRSARGFLVTIVAQGGKTVLTMVSAVVLSRLLKPSDFGLLALISPVTGLFALLSNIGLFQSIVQSKNISQRQITSLFWISICLGLVLTLLFLLSAPIMAFTFHNDKIIGITVVLSTTILMSSLVSVHIAILNRNMEFRKIAIIETSSLFATTAASIGFAVAGFGYWGLVFGQVIGGLSTLALAWYMTPWRPSIFDLRAPETQGMLAFGRNLTISNIAFYLNTSADNMIVGYRLGYVSLGLYDRAWKLGVMPLNQLLNPISRIALPSLSRLQLDQARYRRQFTVMLELMLLLSGPGLIAAIFSAPIIVPGLLGERWHELAPIFRWLCIGGIITPVNAAAFWLFVSQDRSEEQITFSVGAIAINITSYIVGVHWGLEGIVKMSAISVYLFQTPLLAYGACKKGHVALRQLLSALITPFIAVSAAIIICFLTYKIVVPASFLQVAVLFAQAYFFSFATLLLTKNGRSIINNAIRLATLAVPKRFQPRQFS